MNTTSAWLLLGLGVLGGLSAGVYSFFGPWDWGSDIRTDTVTPEECRQQASAVLADEEVRGFHIVCFEAVESDRVTLRVFYDGHDDQLVVSLALNTSRPVLKYMLEAFRDELLPVHERGSPALHQWAAYTRSGEKLFRVADLPPVFYVFEGGFWVWPGVRVGHKAQVGDVVLETLSMTPLVFGIEGFLRPEECDTIIDLALPMMAASEVKASDEDNPKPASHWRTSSTAWVAGSFDSSGTISAIQQRIEGIMHIPARYYEAIQVLRYKLQQFYDAHHDYFDPKIYKGQPEDQNRLATVFWYMSTVDKGGHTVFPRAGGAPPPTDFKDCTHGLLVKPEKGKVILFYSLYPDGTLNPYSLHGGCPVEEGVKYAANQWVGNFVHGEYYVELMRRAVPPLAWIERLVRYFQADG